jgi:glutamyl-Q tRNA(Asp) synthetase
VAALASWLDARANGGLWLVRIEDVDTPRCVLGADHFILQQLKACGLLPDLPPVWQSQRLSHYQRLLDALIEHQLAYPCNCSRRTIEATLKRHGQARTRHAELVYPGTCRKHLTGPSNPSSQAEKAGVAWRLRTDFLDNMPAALTGRASHALNSIANDSIQWYDRRLGAQRQNVQHEVGDFVLQRADGCFTYQLAVVADDAAQGITDVVRGEDLADNTARQILLQHALGLPTPRYLHTPLVRGANGEKLSKQNGALALDTAKPLTALQQAAAVLGLPAHSGTTADALTAWVAQWQSTYTLAT